MNLLRPSSQVPVSGPRSQQPSREALALPLRERRASCRRRRRDLQGAASEPPHDGRRPRPGSPRPASARCLQLAESRAQLTPMQDDSRAYARTNSEHRPPGPVWDRSGPRLRSRPGLTLPLISRDRSSSDRHRGERAGDGCSLRRVLPDRRDCTIEPRLVTSRQQRSERCGGWSEAAGPRC